MTRKSDMDKLLEKMSLACDGHGIGDIMAVMSAMLASIIDDMDIEKGAPLAFSVSLMAIQTAYDLEPEDINVGEYLQ